MQKLIQPITDAGQKRTVLDLLADFTTPVRKAGTFTTLGRTTKCRYTINAKVAA